MSSRVRFFTIAVAAALGAVAVPLAAADAVYHSERLALTPVGAAPLRSGFVLNIKANGPNVYAHELFVLNGAAPNAKFAVKRDFYIGNSGCKGAPSFSSPVGQLETNTAGNAEADLLVTPDEIPDFLRDETHGVRWRVEHAGTTVYRTACTAVTLD
jgi:hypothetical protein